MQSRSWKTGAGDPDDMPALEAQEALELSFSHHAKSYFYTEQYAEPAELEIQMTCPDWKPKKRLERILFLGWRRDMHDIIGVLDKFVDQGSELWLYNEVNLKF